jgi:EAL domain-containing protein (putative c-di-GMP-specific phosphodiesterase class I)
MREINNRLLMVDDEEAILEFVREVAEGVGYQVATARTRQEFLETVREFDPFVIVLDLQLERADGVELIRDLAEADCRAGILLASGMDQRVIASAEQLGRSRGLKMLGAVSKPIDLPFLEQTLERSMQRPKNLTWDMLERAVEEREFVVHYQPKAVLQPDGQWRIGGLEALVRWQHPDYGLVMPDEFIAMAEATGLIGAMTEQVMTDAVGRLAAWIADGLDLTLSVNVPPQEVKDLAFPDRVCRLLETIGVEARRLTLEITETATMKDPTETMDILTRLRVKNIGLALDDFGTGFSSLTQLYHMPFNELKIDKSLIFDIPASREANTMVGSLIDLGHNLGLSVCAEGVETGEALDLLARLGCDTCQGYWISRPIPADAVPLLIADWERRTTGPSDESIRLRQLA